MKTLELNGLPEAVLSVSADVEAGVPVDEIDCALGRANAVITMVMIALGTEDGRPSDHVLIDSLWCAQGQLALIKKLAYHADETTTPKRSNQAKPTSGA
jgi:hypothetical protein